ncbi:MAG TPA: sialate O-acetylesterase [Bacteroidales bacterium]|nr:sialate O-acetylesterase [Bacteroidales bacterium]
MKRIFVLTFLLISSTWFVTANVTLPRIFSDNMVLQRDMHVPVWGHADPGEIVKAALGVHIAQTTADENGHWKLYLGPLDPGGPFELTISGNNRITVRNVLVGEVWVCSGQSNMAMEVENCLDAAREKNNANYAEIRQFQVKRTKSTRPLKDVSPVDAKTSWLNSWEICSPSTVGHFTGTGYFFALELYKKLGIPIGLIHASWGGTTAEAWMPADTFVTDSEFSLILEHWPDYNNDEEWLKEEYANFVKETEKARKNGSSLPLYFNQPSVLFNGIIAPVIPFGIRGVTWYQGESNAYRAYQYQTLFPALIKQWRRAWQQGDFPFLFVQLANYHFEPQVFPELREAQQMALSLPVTAMAVAIDVGDSADIHPKNKQEVGKRLALAARGLIYGEDLVFSGPVYKSMHVEKGRCWLEFDQTGAGLTIADNKPLKGFTVAGTDRIFIEAKAIVDGNRVIVWNENVKDPVAVRYAWANHPQGCNLYNQQNNRYFLPASPFRTDTWPGITQTRK